MDPTQLSRVELLCDALYVGGDQAQREEAQTTLMALQSSAEYIPQCQYILDNTRVPYAQHFASSSLETIFTQFWNNFNIPQKIEIRNYILTFLANNAQSLKDFVVKNLTKLTCRITKLGWFDSPEHRDIIVETTKFLQASVDHKIVGLHLLNALVDEMNTPILGRTLTLHRKTAVSFRDQALFQAFEIAITTLRQVQTRTAGVFTNEEQENRIILFALNLSTACLSFDFIGTNPEESAEDVGTVQVPSSWRPIVQDTSTMQLFFEFYKATEPPRSNQALQAIIQLSSVRRSLFSSETERRTFLQALMTGIQEVMTSTVGLAHEDNYHEFCRLLGRLKASYQLSELVDLIGFTHFLEMSGDFTMKSLQNWQYSMNSIHYLLALWGRMVAALPYLRQDAKFQRQSQTLRAQVLQVVQSYIQTMLDSVQVVVASDGQVDDPLEDEGSLREQMDRLPGIARLQYEEVAQFLLVRFEQALLLYEQSWASGNSNPQVRAQIRVLEGHMTWLTYMVAAIIGAQAPSDPRRTRDELIWDGKLSRCVFLLVQLRVDGMCLTEKLEIAILNYFQSFKKVYMTDSMSSPMTMTTGGSGAAPVHPLLTPWLSQAGGSLAGPDSKDISADSGSIFDAINFGDINNIMNLVVSKMSNNIKFWRDSNEILEQTLEVFVELVSSYSSSKTLLELDSVKFLVQNHVGAHFPFLGYDSDNKHRITFYSALSRLVFTSAEDLDNSFDVFIAPNVEILMQLSQTEDLRTQAVKLALVGTLRDLRGIALATNNKRTFNLFFDAVYPVCFPLLCRVAESCNDDPVVMTALLKFMQEFVQNKSQRVVFEQSSANGILLFRQTSIIVCAYGSRILELPVLQSVYLEKYKGIRLMLNVLTCALSGNYVNFGVFSLYDDKALQNALDVSLQMCLNIPLQDVLTYVKLSKAFYGFLEVLFRSHLDSLSQLPSKIFLTLVNMNHEGLQSSDPSGCALCASTIDHIATYIFLNRLKDKPTVHRLRVHIESEPTIFDVLMSSLFNSLLYSSHANHWAVTRPILSLMLASNSSYIQYRNQLIATQAPENQQKLSEEFSKLETDVQRSVETTNRDRFTQKLTMFRLSVRQFLTL